MRIIAGSARGRKLKSLAGISTRPTADRVREAVFNILGSRVLDSIVLDLFAGSGAMGIEALSRGAHYGAFVEINPAALSVVKQNLEAAGFLNKSRVYKRDAISFLKSTDECFDIIFVDPPYQSGLYVPVMNVIKNRELLKNDGVIIVERASSIPLNEFEGFRVQTDRRYGNTCIAILEKY